MPHKTRMVFEQGHRRKFLVVLDETPEALVALQFAARIAKRTGGGLTLLYVIEPGDFQHWINIEEVRREEELEKSKALFRLARRKLAGVGCEELEPEELVREGKKADEIVQLIGDDEDIAILVLGAGLDADGPGPLVSSLAAGKGAGTFPIPIYIVPGNFSTDDIVSLA